jgi:hypothetical protein
VGWKPLDFAEGKLIKIPVCRKGTRLPGGEIPSLPSPEIIPLRTPRKNDVHWCSRHMPNTSNGPILCWGSGAALERKKRRTRSSGTSAWGKFSHNISSSFAGGGEISGVISG